MLSPSCFSLGPHWLTWSQLWGIHWLSTMWYYMVIDYVISCINLFVADLISDTAVMVLASGSSSLSLCLLSTRKLPIWWLQEVLELSFWLPICNVVVSLLHLPAKIKWMHDGLKFGDNSWKINMEFRKFAFFPWDLHGMTVCMKFSYDWHAK